MTNHNCSITSEEFVQEFRDLRDELIQRYFTFDFDISRIALLEKSGMNSEQMNLTKKLFQKL